MKQTRQLRLIIKDLDIDNLPEFPVRIKSVKAEVQKTLFGNGNKRRAHILMGTFYELMSIVLYGGKLADGFFLDKKTDENEKNGNHLSGMIKPDVLNAIIKLMIESKAVRSGHQFIILDEQIDRYKLYQSMFPEFKIYYTIWRHSLRNIKTYSQDHETLFKELCQKTVCCLVFPLRVILNMHQCKEFMRYESENWYYCTRVNSGFLNLPFSNQEKFFEVLQLPSDQFDISFYKLPLDISVCGFNISSFPVAVVKDLKYEDWAINFSDDFIPF